MARNILASIVSGVTVSSAWGPDIVIDQPFADSPPSPVAGAVGRWLKPKVTLQLTGGGEVSSAPYGEPGASNWPLVQAGLIIGAMALFGLLAAKIIK